MKKLLSGMGLALALGACVSTPQPNAALESARAAVQAAETDPYVSKYAALDLDVARKDLAAADDAALHHRGEAAIRSESARAAVQAAETDPYVSKYAALDLDVARKDLAAADDAALHHRGEAAIEQPAYMAAQNARLAQMHAATKADDARVAAGQTERDQIMLAARNREAYNAKLATNIDPK